MRVDSASLIAGALVVGDRGLGVLGSDIPATGEHGAGYVYNDLSLPADAGKEVRGLIVTPPSAGQFFAYEDTSFTFVGAPDGAYTFVYRLFVDGADLGTATATLNVGSVTTVNLTGNNATQINNSTTGAISTDSTVFLAGNNATQSNSSSTGAITSSGPITLTGANSTQTNSSGAGQISQPGDTVLISMVGYIAVAQKRNYMVNQ